MMRFTTFYSYQNSVNYFNNAMGRGFDLNEHISAGMANMRPSDAPAKASTAVQLQTALGRISQFEAARTGVKASLSFEETTLNGVVNNITLAKSSIVKAGNADMMSQSDRDTMAQELQSYRDTLMSLANTRDSNGNYIFSGFKSDTPAFAADGTYQGSNRCSSAEIEDGYSVALGHTGDKVYSNGSDNVFDALDQAIAALQNGNIDQSTLHNALDKAGSVMDSMLDNVATVRSDLGSTLKTIDDLSASASTNTINIQKRLSETVGNDPKAQVGMISQQNMAQYSLQASTMAFQSMNSMNLFNLLK